MSESEDPQKDIIDKKAFNKDANVSQFVMNLTNTVDNADGQLFPNLYNQIQQDFAENYHISITLDQLGWITTVRSLLQAITTPMWGWWNDKHSRKKVLAFGCSALGCLYLIDGIFSEFYPAHLISGDNWDRTGGDYSNNSVGGWRLCAASQTGKGFWLVRVNTNLGNYSGDDVYCDFCEHSVRLAICFYHLGNHKYRISRDL